MTFKAPNVLGPSEEEILKLEQSYENKKRALLAVKSTFGLDPPDKPVTPIPSLEHVSAQDLEKLVPILLRWYQYLGWAIADVDADLQATASTMDKWEELTIQRHRSLKAHTGGTLSVADAQHVKASLGEHPTFAAYENKHSELEIIKKFLSTSFGYVDRALKTLRPAQDGVRHAPQVRRS